MVQFEDLFWRVCNYAKQLWLSRKSSLRLWILCMAFWVFLDFPLLSKPMACWVPCRLSSQIQAGKVDTLLGPLLATAFWFLHCFTGCYERI